MEYKIFRDSKDQGWGNFRYSRSNNHYLERGLSHPFIPCLCLTPFVDLHFWYVGFSGVFEIDVLASFYTFFFYFLLWTLIILELYYSGVWRLV